MISGTQFVSGKQPKWLTPIGQLVRGSRSFGAKFGIFTTFLLILLFASQANAAAALLLEEPYGKLGAFMAQGHAAIYLSRVCAETPLVLRRCGPGETGVVISRYNGVAGYDWIAIPLTPYFYSVEQTDDIPLFANPKLVAFLRNQYRRKYLKTIAPDGPDGETPEGNWF